MPQAKFAQVVHFIIIIGFTKHIATAYRGRLQLKSSEITSVAKSLTIGYVTG